MPIEQAQAPNKSDMVTKKATWQQKGKWVPKVSQEEGLAPTPMIPAPTSQIAAASTIPSQNLNPRRGRTIKIRNQCSSVCL